MSEHVHVAQESSLELLGVEMLRHFYNKVLFIAIYIYTFNL